MNIYIINTPEIDVTLKAKIINLANIILKEIKIINPSSNVTDEDISIVVKNYKHKKIFDFTEFFKICHNYRLKNSIITEKDFVVLLTNKQNSKEWFSAVYKRNIFIDINNWETITKKASLFSILHQIFENIFQSLIGIDYDKVKGNKHIHMKSIGCVNDFCEDRNDIIIKFTSANICQSCIDLAIRKKISPIILNEISEVLDYVRIEIKTKIPIISEIELKKLRIDSRGNIYLGNDIMKMKLLASALYIFFLLNNNIRFTRLSKNKEQLLRIYAKLKPGGNKHLETIDRLVDNNKKSFLDTKSQINNCFKSHLNNLLLKYYQLLPTSNNPNGNYHIALPSEYIDIDPNFTL